MATKPKFEKVEDGELFKFENKGDEFIGQFASIEESKKFPDSFLVKVRDGENMKAVFVNKIVADKIFTAQVQLGHMIKIVFLGKKKNEQGTREYNNFDVFVAR